jgi:selenocysteine-specific elongation factor
LEIQPIVIGTAGHIDHGKSTLVQALTGIDPDRWAEEKERGMTIDLGFARMQLPDGRQVGLVDVPGHERFVRNMVAGASGIDLVILVVAADDGVMPQTREHLAIMELLGVERGFVALTKIDIVDEDLVELAEEDVLETVAGTFLEGAPVLRVSVIAGRGLEELKALLCQMAADTPPRSAEGVFRMPVQRVFSARGFGTIVTGIPVAGSVKAGDVLEVLPSGQKGKVRGIQAYHDKAEQARAGHSTALNLADVDHNRVARGDVVATPGFFQPQKMVGARMRALADLGRPVTNRMPVRVHTGTSDALGEVVLLDHEDLAPGAEGLVQFRLEEPLVCAPGDRFVVRLASPVITLGGGFILEESRYRLKRFKHFVIGELERQAASLGSPDALLESHLARAQGRWATTDELAVALKRGKPETRALLEGLVAAGKARSAGANRWIHTETLALSLDETRDALQAWFAENPHRQRMDVRELRTRTAFDAPFLSMLLERLAEVGEVAQEAGGFVALTGRVVELDEASRELHAEALAAFEAGRFQPPTRVELAAQLGRPQADVERIFQLLVDEGALEHVGAELYCARSCMDEARAAVTENCEKHGQLEIPELRDRLGTTRKFLIPILEHFDAQGLTLRQGGTRVLRRRGS